MDVLELQRNSLSSAKGVESIYFQMAEDWGVKVMRDPIGQFRGHELKFSTPEELMAHDYWKLSMETARIMKFFETLERGPKLHEMFIIWDNDEGTYAVAFKLEHIKFKMMHDGDSDSGWSGPRSKANYKIGCLLARKYGIGDSHNENLVFCDTSKRFKMLDFGSRMDTSSIVNLEPYTPNFTGTRMKPERKKRSIFEVLVSWRRAA